METPKIQVMSVKDIKPYENNPRRNDMAVDAVAESIKEFGFKNPIIIDRNGTIVAGHTRYKAAKKLKLKEVPCICVDDLTDEQVNAYRLADNKTSELSEWDDDLLGKELEQIHDIDMSAFGFVVNENGEVVDEDNPYTMAVNIPQYEITGECPKITELVEVDKTQELLKKIEKSNVTEDEKAFLREAAGRHNVFNYRNIAEYYAHANKEMQQLMEDSALVIIDMEDAIAGGYVNMTSDIQAQIDGDEDEE